MRSGPDQRPGNRFRGNPSQQRRGNPQGPQTFDSHGPGDRIRGNASQICERYLALAREAAQNDDRVASENYYQHAEHYFRVNKLAREGNSPASQTSGQASADAGPAPAAASSLSSTDGAQEDTAANEMRAPTQN
jgi:hypothetical protein